MTSLDMRRQLEGYGLTTAGIYYRLPDYRRIIQLFVWQEYDIHPEFPCLHAFLDFWRRSLDGPLHSVTVVHARLIKPAEMRIIDGEFRIQ